MRIIALAALLAATAAAPAFAQDTGAAPFTGPRIEGQIGWDRAQNGGHDDGVHYGIAAGYDMNMNGLIVGAEAELADSTTKTCDGAGTTRNPEVCLKSGRDIYVGGRVGTVVGGGKALLYAKAGYTNARARVTYDDGVDRLNDGANLDGLRVGAGAEYAIDPNSYLKVEYRYSNYEDGFSRNQVIGGFGFRF